MHIDIAALKKIWFTCKTMKEKRINDQITNSKKKKKSQCFFSSGTFIPFFLDDKWYLQIVANKTALLMPN